MTLNPDKTSPITLDLPPLLAERWLNLTEDNRERVLHVVTPIIIKIFTDACDEHFGAGFGPG